MSRARGRTDANHAEIVKALRQAGCAVCDLSGVGKGCPDLLVSRGFETMLLEVKDGAKSPSERRLTPAQQEFHAMWRGRIAVVTSITEALAIIETYCL